MGTHITNVNLLWSISYVLSFVVSRSVSDFSCFAIFFMLLVSDLNVFESWILLP
jgi:hypothetical protein